MNLKKEFKTNKWFDYKVLAICKKTYPDEDDMRSFCAGEINDPSKVKVYHKGKKYWVVEKYVDKDFYEIIKD